MTNKDRLVEIFRRHDWKMTLGLLLTYPEGYKCTSRFSELRKEGFTVTFTKGKTPSENMYEIKCPEKNGQMRML